jgi:methyl-accepting chemotaxis protein
MKKAAGGVTESGRRDGVSGLIEYGRRLVETDFSALNRALTDLGHGDLSTTVLLKCRPVRRQDYPGFEELADVFNAMFASLKKGASEFNSATAPPCHRLCYVGADSFLEGYTCGEAMGSALGGRGQVAIMHRPGMVSHQLRRKGFTRALAERFQGIKISVDVDSGMSAADVQKAAVSLLASHPDIDGIYIAHGGVTPAIARAAEAAGKGGKLKIVGHDFGDETIDFLRKGLITATLGQDPYAQGHDSVIHLFNHLVAGWEPPMPRLLTTLELATPETAERHRDQSKEGLRADEKGWRRYARPIPKTAPKPIRIAVLGRAPNSFWNIVHDGVKGAAEEIRPYDATVDWIVPEAQLKEGKVSADVYAPALESAIKQGYEGIALAIFDAAMVPYINRATDSCVPIITFNAEPAGLSSMVLLSTDQAQKLQQISGRLATSIEQITQATEQVRISIEQVSRATVTQNEQVNRANASLDELLSHIDAVTGQANEGAVVAERAAAASQAGAEAVVRTANNVTAIRSSVSETGNAVERLGSSSERIDTVVRLIGGIARQIKLLGINAAIEAAHAGRYGAGFSVVAGEIRSLGEKSSTASREITEIVDQVQTEIDSAQEVMSSELQQVEAGASLAQEAARTLEQIRDAVTANKDRLGVIGAAVAEMQAFSRSVGSVMLELTAISEENSAAAEQVGAAANQMLAELSRVNRAAQSLAEMARASQQLLAKFTLAEADS